MPAAAGRSRLVLLCFVMAPTPFGRSLRGEAGAVDLPAGAGRHVDPGIARCGLLRLAGTGMRCGLAIILASDRDAEALLGLERRYGSGTGACDKRQSDGRGNSGSNEQGCLHVGNTPLRSGFLDEAAATSVMCTLRAGPSARKCRLSIVAMTPVYEAKAAKIRAVPAIFRPGQGWDSNPREVARRLAGGRAPSEDA